MQFSLRKLIKLVVFLSFFLDYVPSFGSDPVELEIYDRGLPAGTTFALNASYGDGKESEEFSDIFPKSSTEPQPILRSISSRNIKEIQMTLTFVDFTKTALYKSFVPKLSVLLSLKINLYPTNIEPIPEYSLPQVWGDGL